VNILVTGASGFIGSHLVRKLAKNAENTIIAFLRKESRSPAPAPNVKIVECDILDTSRLREVVRAADVVIHLAAIKEHHKGREAIFSANLRGTENLLENCKNVKHFIFASSTLASNPTDPYSETKKQSEELIRKSGIDFTILRIAPVFGSGDGTNLTKVIDLIRNGKTIPIPGDGMQIIQPTHVDDVVEAIESSILNKEFMNRTCVVAGKPVTLKEFMDLTSKVLGKQTRRMHIPIKVLRPMVKVYQKVSDDPKITVEQLDNLGKTQTTSVFDSDFPTSRLEIGIQKTAG
jgi:NADH dehydrogenase